MKRIATITALLLITAGCEPMTPEQTAQVKIKSPFPGGEVVHDDHRAVTCWKWSSTGSGSPSGLSCIPDWMLQPGLQPDQQSAPSPAQAPAARKVSERYWL